VFILSVAGNIFSYTYIKKLQHKQDVQILQYDSLLSAKLLTDQELAWIKARLHTYPIEEKWIRVKPQEVQALPEDSHTDEK
jgi:hypothetical protein